MKPRSSMFVPAILILVGLATACLGDHPPKGALLPPTAAPPGETVQLLATGVVQGVSTSARVIFLSVSNMGIDTVAINDGTQVIDSSGAPLSLREIQPGQRIQARGEPSHGSLLAGRVTILDDPRQDEPSLMATLEASPTVPDGRTVIVTFTLTNNSEVDLWVLNWYTPLEGGIYGEVFRVTRDGQEVPYEGPLVMRGDPLRENYLRLRPGESISAAVDLATVYDLGNTGEYTIRFLAPTIGCVANSEAELCQTVDDLGLVAMPCEPVTVTILADA